MNFLLLQYIIGLTFLVYFKLLIALNAYRKAQKENEGFAVRGQIMDILVAF